MEGFYHHSDNRLEQQENLIPFDVNPMDFSDEGKRPPVKRGKLRNEAPNSQRGPHGLEGDVTEGGGLKRPTSPFAGFGQGEPWSTEECETTNLHVEEEMPDDMPADDDGIFEGQGPNYD